MSDLQQATFSIRDSKQLIATRKYLSRDKEITQKYTEKLGISDKLTSS